MRTRYTPSPSVEHLTFIHTSPSWYTVLSALAISLFRLECDNLLLSSFRPERATLYYLQPQSLLKRLVWRSQWHRLLPPCDFDARHRSGAEPTQRDSS